MADPLSITAGVVGLLAFAGGTLTKGYSILQSLRESKRDITRLLIELSQLTGILVAIEAQGREAKNTANVEQGGANAFPYILDSSVSNCRKMVVEIWGILQKLEKSRRAVLAIKWQFLEPDVKKLTQEIEHYKSIFILCLGVDVRKKTDQMLELQREIYMQLEDLKNEKEKEKSTAREDRARLDRRALMRWLVPKSDESHAKALKLWAPETGNWLIKHADFISWAVGPHSLLWLNGIPGSGKTILMSHVVEDLKVRSISSAERRGLAYFYCTYNASESHGISHILCSLAAQLIRLFPQPETGSAMRLWSQCDDGTLAPKVDQIQSLLCNMINDFEVTFICLDALDECSPDTRSELFSFIYEVIGRCDNVKIIVSSRSGDSEVSESLDGCPSITITPHAVARDIDIYIRHRIDQGPKRLKLARSEYMVDRLTSGAEGMFLWVSCQMDQLSLLNSTAGVHGALSSLPRGLYGTYNRILDGILPENRDVATKALRWLTHSTVPLSLVELVEAIAVDKDSRSLDSLQKLFVPEDIFGICGSLVRRSEVTGTLSLAHSSVYEFLTAAVSQSHLPNPYYMPTALSNVVLAKTCLTYLSFPDFNMAVMQAKMDPYSYNESNLNIPGTGSLADCPFFDYTLKNWWKHLPTLEEGFDEVWPSLLQFFDTESGNFGSLIMLLHHVEGTYRYPMAMQPIHFCATHGLDLISQRLLFDVITDVECKVEDGRTALHMAAENGHENVAQQLLIQGAEADAESADGRTPLQFALESGNESIAQLLIQRGADVNANLAGGETPLSVAVGNHWAALVQLLLREKANPNGCLPDGRTSLHVAAEVGSELGIVKLLCDEGADPRLGDEKLWTALHYAAQYGHKAVASMFLDLGRIDEIFERIGWTPLHAAIEQQHIEIVRLFARHAKKVSIMCVHQSERRRLAPISTSRSSTSKAWGTAQDARESSASGRRTSPPTASITSESIPTPLFLATSQDYTAGVDALIEAGAATKDVDHCVQHAYGKGKVAVLKSLVHKSENPMKLLLSLRAKGTPSPGESQISLEVLFESFHWNESNILGAMKQVVRQSNHELLRLLTNRFSHLDDGPRTQVAEHFIEVLQDAVESRNVQAVELLQTTGAEVSRPVTAVLGKHESREISCTLLHQAAQLQGIDMTSYLLRFIEPNVIDARCRTPLHYAAEVDSKLSSTLVLHSFGAGISPRDDQGWTPLHVASHYGVSDGVSSLLAAGAEIDALDRTEMTPLHHCAYSFPWSRRYPSKAMSLLLEAGASTSSLNKDGYTPSQLAMITSIKSAAPDFLCNVLDAQRDLISAKLPPLDRTALHFAAEAGSGLVILRLLLSMGADLEAEDKDVKTAVQIATGGAHRLLINHGAQWRV